MANSGKNDVAIVAAFAAAIRTLVVVLTAIFANVSAPHDSSASLDPSLPAAPGTADLVVQKLLSPLGHWDGVFFLHLAEHGYTYEMFHAFFPGLPLAMKALSIVVAPIASLFGLSQRSILLISGALFTWVHHAISARLHSNLNAKIMQECLHCGCMCHAILSHSLCAKL